MEIDYVSMAKDIIKDGLARLTEEEDLKRFSPILEICNTATGMLQGDDKEYMYSILKAWMVSQANNMMFLLFRRELITPEIDELYRKLISTEEAVKDYDRFEDEMKADAEALEEQRKAYAEKQHGIDIFKAVLNGMSKEQAEAEYEKYKAQLAQAMRG